MYKPAPVRPKKTNISRSRNGCENCRQKRSKCDEQKPSCSTCVRLGLTCKFNQKPFQFRVATFPPNDTPIPSRWPSQLPSRSMSSTGAQIPTNEIESVNVIDSFVAIAEPGCGNQIPISSHLVNGHKSDLLDAPSQLGAINLGSEQLGLEAPLQPGAITEEIGAKLYPPVVLHSTRSRSWLRTETALLYATHWEKSCLFALGPIYSQLSTHMELCPVFRDATLALSACNMSRTHPELQNSDSLVDQNSVHRPHLAHLSYSQMYYNSALRKLSQLSSTNYRSNLLGVLAAIVLLCYMDSSICNFRGHYCHAEGLSSLLATDIGEIRNKFGGGELLATWAQSRYYNWWIRIHFSTLNFQNSQDALYLSVQHCDINESRSGRRAMLLSILCESYRLSSKAFFQWWNFHKFSPPIDGSRDSYSHEDYKYLLLVESERLQEWESRLEIPEMPTEPVHSTIPTGWTLSNAYSRLKPLKFLSHEASIYYAYYTAARIMQSFVVENELGSGARSTNCIENDYWTTIFLRVVKGINYSNCVRENVYTIGISGLLLACILRSTRFITGRLIETWLKNFQHEQVFEEGSLPISQIVAIVSTINQQRRAGYDVFAVSPVLEDGGGSGKLGSFTNQTLSEVLVFGRHRQTGSAFSKCVSVTNHTEVD